MAESYDVVICGGGPAGIGAALTAAREGARTLLVEALGSLGGIGTNANINLLCDGEGGPVMDEIVRDLLRIDAAQVHEKPPRFHPPGRVNFDADVFKCVAVAKLRQAGVEILFGSMAGAPLLRGNAVEGVSVTNKGGTKDLRAAVVVDATADADIATRAGAQIMRGDPDGGRIQMCNFRFHIEGVDPTAWDAARMPPEEIERLCVEAQLAGELRPPRGVFAPTPESFPFDRRSRKLALTSWELAGIDPTDPASLSAALAECYAAALDVALFCRKYLPGYARCRPARLPALIGTRESRRVLGEYLLTGDDVLKGAKFPDGVARASFWFDYHDPPPGTTVPYPEEYVHSTRPAFGDWYEIPYRCLVPKGVESLLVAGRCISADRPAQASMRIMPTCCYLGAAAGLAAALAARGRVAPRAIDGRELKRRLVPEGPIAGPERWR
jgi:hypothetical protein